MIFRLIGLILFSIWLGIALWSDFRTRSVSLPLLLLGIFLAVATRALGWGDLLGALLIIVWITATYGRPWLIGAILLIMAWMLANPGTTFGWAIAMSFLLCYVLWKTKIFGNADYIAAILLIGLAGDARMPLLLGVGTVLWSITILLLRRGIKGSLLRIREVFTRLRKDVSSGAQDEQGLRMPWYLLPALAGWIYFWLWPAVGWK